MPRYLRIAFSAVCGIACVLLVVWWLRGYWYQDYVSGRVSNSRSIHITSWHGWVSFHSIWDTKFLKEPSQLSAWDFTSHFIKPDPIFGKSALPRPGWVWHERNIANRQTSFNMVVPCWSPVLFVAAFAALPWLGSFRRFSLKTLLIATTVLAVVLGFSVWASS
jgi:hypothetical protein